MLQILHTYDWINPGRYQSLRFDKDQSEILGAQNDQAGRELSLWQDDQNEDEPGQDSNQVNHSSGPADGTAWGYSFWKDGRRTVFQHAAASGSYVYRHATCESRTRKRRMRWLAFGVLAALFACSVSSVQAQEKRKPTRQLNEAPFRPLMTEGVNAIKARKPAEAVKIFDGVDQKFRDAYAKGPRVYCSRSSKETVFLSDEIHGRERKRDRNRPALV